MAKKQDTKNTDKPVSDPSPTAGPVDLAGVMPGEEGQTEATLTAPPAPPATAPTTIDGATDAGTVPTTEAEPQAEPTTEPVITGPGVAGGIDPKVDKLMDPPKPEAPDRDQVLARIEQLRAMIDEYAQADGKAAASWAGVMAARNRAREEADRLNHLARQAEAEHTKNHMADRGWSYQIIELPKLLAELEQLQAALG